MKKIKLIYIFDTLCTWCYGFSPVAADIREKYKKVFDFEIISGGLVLKERVGPIHKIAPLGFHNVLERIAETSGVTFGKEFLKQLEDGANNYDSMIPATALGIFKLEKPEQSFEFAHAMQKAIYAEGKDLTQDAFYFDLAFQFGLDGYEFVKKMKQDKHKQYATYDFVLAKQLKATAFPRLYLQTGNTYFYLIAEGFTDFETLDARIQKILEEIS